MLTPTTKRDFWLAADDRGTILFYGAKPQKIKGQWHSLHGFLGILPEKDFPAAEYQEPVHKSLLSVRPAAPTDIDCVIGGAFDRVNTSKKLNTWGM
jgi:hypothetical protein